MALKIAGVPTSLLCFAAGLLTRFTNVFAFASSVTLFTAEMRPALQFSTTNLATANLCKPARLVLERLLPAQTWLLCQEWALRALFLIPMTIVRDARMATILRPFAIEATWRGCGTARQRWLQHSLAAVTANLVENSFSTASARPFVTKLWTCMVPAF